MTPAHARPILWLAGRATLQIPCSACWAGPTDLAIRPGRLFRGAIVLLQLVGFAKRIQDSRWGATKAKFLFTEGACLAVGGEGVAASVHDDFLVDDKSKMDTASERNRRYAGRLRATAITRFYHCFRRLHLPRPDGSFPYSLVPSGLGTMASTQSRKS